MASRWLLSSRIGTASKHVRRPARQHIRLLTSTPLPKQSVVTPPHASSKEQSWLTHRVKANPVLYAVFLGFARALGYGSPKQLANRRALHMYNILCAMRADQEADFWRKGTTVRFPFYRPAHAFQPLKNVHYLLLSSPGLQSLIYTYGSSPSVYGPCPHHME